MLMNQVAAFGTLLQDRLDRAFGELSPRASAVLLTLLSRGDLTVTALAGIVGVAQPTATRLIGGLERQGYLERAARQGRIVVVTLTENGHERAHTLRRQRHLVAVDLLQALDAQERASLEGLLRNLLHGATTSRNFARTTCRYCNHGICAGADCPVDRRATEIEQTGATSKEAH